MIRGVFNPFWLSAFLSKMTKFPCRLKHCYPKTASILDPYSVHLSPSNIYCPLIPDWSVAIIISLNLGDVTTYLQIRKWDSAGVVLAADLFAVCCRLEVFGSGGNTRLGWVSITMAIVSARKSTSGMEVVEVIEHAGLASKISDVSHREEERARGMCIVTVVGGVRTCGMHFIVDGIPA
ncbi:hypothetical protein Tco_0018513 [Tanacetum coccineum]